MSRISYDESLRRLNEQVESDEPIIGAGAGTGISAKFAERGGVDVIIIYNSGRFRMAGRGSCAGLLPYGDANEIVQEMAGEVIPVVEDTPVLAGVCGTDPFRQMPNFLDKIKKIGFEGVQNFPTVGVIDGHFRQTLEETGMSIDLEVDMIELAHERNLLTCPYAFNVEEAKKMTQAGGDVIVAHMNTTTKGDTGAETALSLDEAADRVQEIADTVHSIDSDRLVLCHGGPIAEPEDAQYIFDHTENVVGFFGASSIERLASEPAIENQARRFKDLDV